MMLLALPALANPQLDPTNPTSFFTNVAMAMFQQMDLRDFNGNLVTVTNIPIYEDPARFGGTNINYYTPAVHRILQLAANIFDATTNRFIDGGPTNYPTVFRPIFSSENGIASIIGYAEVTNSAPAFLPFLDPTNFVMVTQPVNSSINMYGVPWVIGAKKGFPNFNEVSIENPLTATRILQFTNSIAQPPWKTNQIYDFFITNSFGVEVWNSYTNAYGRPLRLVVTNELTVVVTNQFGVSFVTMTNRPYGNDLSTNSWPGWGLKRSDNSFQVPLMISDTFTNALYLQHAPFVVPVAPPQWDATVVPRIWIGLRFRLRYCLIDTSVDRVIDFVNIVNTQPAVDISGILGLGASGRISLNLADQWATNTSPYGALVGVMNQIFASEGQGGTIADWHDLPANIASEENTFRHWINNGGVNSFLAPYSPSRTIYQRISLQANDPLVHYLGTDLTSTNGPLSNYNRVDLLPRTIPLDNLNQLNLAYQPWGGNITRPGGTSLNPNPEFDLNYQVKDPRVYQSDNWDFPTGEALSFEWLGRLHRGTPWQTVFLKPSNLAVSEWLRWNNDTILITNGYSLLLDAVLTHPNNDWPIASLWAQWLNTNDLSTLLSINNTDTNAWAARLDGLTALTNSAAGELDPITISSNSLDAGFIAQAIQTARANTSTDSVIFPNHAFQEVGDVLATPQLSVASPFINTNGLSTPSANGLTDEALEKIPTQLLPLLRVDSFGKIVPADGEIAMSFSGYDGHTYAIEASSNLTDWVVISTNCPSDGNFGITNTPTPGQQFYRSVLLH
ncbi:MAG TPA: hypothetical protein VGI88_04555 [Verrucomicrobiae bacterium]|jgi:hypothetical protein